MSQSFIIYKVTISQAYRDLCTYNAYFFKPKRTKEDCHMFILVPYSSTILHRLVQLCFTRVVLDSGDSRK